MDTPFINPARVDFVTLRLFCAVAEMGSISKGATNCRLALSAASRRLSDFELTVGMALLQRSSLGISLTEAGKVALLHVQHLLSGFEQFSREMKDYAQGTRGHVRLWANMSAMLEFLPDALALFARRCPEVEVDVKEQMSGVIIRAVKDGTADIGVITGAIPDESLNLQPFHRDELVLICSPAHALARRRTIAFAETLEYEYIGLSQGSSLQELTTEAANRLGKQLSLRVQVSNFDAACQMIAVNLGIAILPRLACRSQIKTLGLRAIRLSDTWAIRQLFAATRAGHTLSPAARQLYEHLTNAKNG